jgi:hypothetical protein
MWIRRYKPDQVAIGADCVGPDMLPIHPPSWVVGHWLISSGKVRFV